MQQRTLGRSGLRVSRLGLGTMTWGLDIDEHEATEQLRTYVEAGGTLVDTAHVYGGGASEELLGRILDDVVPRDDVVLATKAGFSVHGEEVRHDTSRRGLLAHLDTSLRRLGVDHVDLWQVHTFSEETPLEETLAALDHAVATGRTAYVGVSNWNGWRTGWGATWQHAVPGRAPLVSNQVEYSLLNRACEADVVPAAQALGLGVLPYSPLARGVLTGKYRTGTPSDSRGAGPGSAYIEAYLDTGHRRVVDAVARAAEGLGWTPQEVALVWVRDRPGVTAPLVGARTTAQLKAALACEDKELPPEIVTALDDVSAPADPATPAGGH